MTTRLLALACTVAALALQGCTSQQSFSTPDEAGNALAQALAGQDRAQLKHIFGPEAPRLRSDEPTQDRSDLAYFAQELERGREVRMDSDSNATLLVGQERWPFAVPLVRTERGAWAFDTEAGIEELSNRRIGRNELRTILACRTLIDAQQEYFAIDRDGDGVNEYAAKLLSTEGTRDGLYWPAPGGIDPSPIGPAFAAAATDTDDKGRRLPFYGYHYKPLLSQGPSAPGGSMDYVTANGQTNGWAAIAVPAIYGQTGIMSFIVSHSGEVYEQDLGDGTQSFFRSVTSFDPSAGWTSTRAAPLN